MEKKTQLASVKHQLYHPRLPTLRKMDMDTVSHLLSTKHSRHTTSCNKSDFTAIRTTRHPTVPTLHCKDTADASIKAQIASYRPLENSNKSQYTLRWKEILNQMNDPNTPRNNNNENQGQTGNVIMSPSYSNLYIRKIHPDIASSWKTALLVKDQPCSSFVATSKPMPATIYSRYRSTRRPYSAYPWY